jgi:hypothetical protein
LLWVENERAIVNHAIFKPRGDTKESEWEIKGLQDAIHPGVSRKIIVGILDVAWRSSSFPNTSAKTLLMLADFGGSLPRTRNEVGVECFNYAYKDIEHADKRNSAAWISLFPMSVSQPPLHEVGEVRNRTLFDVIPNHCN